MKSENQTEGVRVLRRLSLCSPPPTLTAVSREGGLCFNVAEDKAPAFESAHRNSIIGSISSKLHKWLNYLPSSLEKFKYLKKTNTKTKTKPFSVGTLESFFYIKGTSKPQDGDGRGLSNSGEIEWRL